MQKQQSLPASNIGVAKGQANILKHHLEARAGWQILIHPVKVVTTLNFVQSLELEQVFMDLVKRKKSSLGQYIYFLEIELNGAHDKKSTLKWTLRRRFEDLKTFRKELLKEIQTKHIVPNTKIPELPESDEPPKRTDVTNNYLMLEAMCSFLNLLLGDPVLRYSSRVLYDFLEISLLPLPNGPKKYKEGYMRKRTGGRYKEYTCSVYCGILFKRWLRRWFIINNEGILYTINSSGINVREMLLFDQTFRIEYGRKLTGTKVGITIVTSNRRLALRAYDLFQAVDWILAIQEARQECPYTKINRYLSFAPIRPPTTACKWYIDAENYFEDIYDKLLEAQSEVFITDWWLSPELYLKRPVMKGDATYRLDTVLGEIAKRGVKVYIIVYREVKMALYNDSEYTKRALQALSPNIRVLRHPNQFLFMWSHHEKLVIIDQNIGFLGGLDLCYGRMDTNAHPLNDPAFEEGHGETFPGIDFVNSRLADFKNVRDYNTSTISKTTIPRMPWHDIAIMVVGEPSRDLARHFIQYWNFAKLDLKPKKEDYFLTPVMEKLHVKTKHNENSPKLPSKKQGLKAIISHIIPSQKTLSKIIPHHGDKNDAGVYYKLSEDTSAADHTQMDEYVKLKLKANAKSEPFKEAAISLTAPIKSANTNNKLAFRPIEERYIEEKEEDSNHLNSHNVLDEEQKINPSHTTEETVYKNRSTLPYLDLEEQAPETALDISTGEQWNIDISSPKRRMSMKGKCISSDLYSGGENELNVPFLKMARSVTTFHKPKHINTPQEDRVYNDKYASLLKKVRDREQLAMEVQISNRPSRMKASLLNTGPVIKLKNDEPEEELNDRFFEQNMLQLSVIKERTPSIKGTCSCQVVRSGSHWSLGLNANENIVEYSIQIAYIELIQNAKHFIYIENQFFISSTAGEPVTNEVVNAILLRIEKAHKNGETFKVVVFLPLLPGFEGEVDDAQSTIIRIQLHWEYQTICRGGTSLFEELEKRNIPPGDYIGFYSLRQHGKMSEVPVTEIIYIHSKLMIVDDDKAIVGSANINDRSMQGSRDSEIGIVVEDSKKVKILMNGEETLVGESVHKLRKQLYSEHLNLPEEEVEDPLNVELLQRMSIIAKRNTEIYREVFACYPDDNVTRLQEIKEFKKQRDLDKYDQLAPSIQGNIVQFPLDFLKDDVLTFAMTNKEYYMPHIGFT